MWGFGIMPKAKAGLLEFHSNLAKVVPPSTESTDLVTLKMHCPLSAIYFLMKHHFQHVELTRK
jgi:hypothetical protein